jgi:3-methyladenine DNA glycosylase AlkD
MPSTSPTLAALRRAIRANRNPADARFLQRYFKTGPGEYAEGDRFLGIRVPVLRTIARSARDLSIADAFTLLHSHWHEERLVALLLLVDRYRRGTPTDQRAIYRGYLANTRYINNWDLVDSSAEHIVGPFAHDRGSSAQIETLARSRDLWRRRIAMLATFHFIKHGEFDLALHVAETLMGDTHDLIHKASGWMVREIWNRDPAVAERFVTRHHRTLPRTMLRYAIEKMPEPRRRGYLQGVTNVE